MHDIVANGTNAMALLDKLDRSILSPSFCHLPWFSRSRTHSPSDRSATDYHPTWHAGVKDQLEERLHAMVYRRRTRYVYSRARKTGEAQRTTYWFQLQQRTRGSQIGIGAIRRRSPTLRIS